jgi:hypothetical protein
MQAFFRSALGAVMAASMATASTVAIAAPAPQAAARTPAEVAQAENLSKTGWFMVGAAALVIILMIVVLSDNDDDDLPASP